ncbi:T9SS type A sorting domain-containing protein [uncultured Polaribacter sp.]|uniref:T9SS type A sorting domain-containing protein n=1 Tax=uncultured Polaribacter sp. TaxID=174711 RepID=UPI00260D4D4F|nr:T9SS type A sorting domain-containing protein [uncultured Polaribacter sp.]
MKKITLLLTLLTFSIGYSQTYDLLESFNGSGLEGTFGSTTAQYATDPVGTDQVVQITSNTNGDVWQGVDVDLASNYKLTSDTQLTMQLDVYSTTAITIAPKAQGGVSGAPDSVTSVDHTGSGWENLTLTFDKSLDGKVPANGIYADFALHINWDTTNNNFGASDGRVFYIKNLKGLLSAPVVNSQTYDLLESFNGSGLEGTFGDTAAQYATDPVGTDQVLQITSNSNGAIWQGVNFDFASNYKLTSDTQLTMQLDVYSTTAITIAPKAQGGESGAPDSVTSVDHTGSGWENLTLTFDKSLDGKVPANGIYADFALHINWDTANNNFGASDGRVFYIRNLKGLLSASTVEIAPTNTPPTPPSFDAQNVMSLYSEAYTASTSILNSDWDDSSMEEVTIAGNKVLKVSGNNFLGIILGDYLDATTMTHLHMDYWLAVDHTQGQVLNPKLSNHAAQSGETSAIDITNTINSQNEVKKWQSKEFALNGDRNSVKEFLITQAGKTGLYYLDNVYLYVAGTASLENNKLLGLSMFPNPASDKLNISVKEAISNLEIFNILGKKVMSVNVNDTRASINISSLTSGVYLIKYNVGNTIGTSKFIKQ